jgi:drug/metabolite transporter (DMT)-like permease
MDAGQVPRATGARPGLVACVLAFAVLYLGYGLNFLAVRIGVETMPPFLFAGAHVTLAGAILALWLRLRGEPVLLPTEGLRRAGTAGAFLFVGGVGLVTVGEKMGVPSGVASIVKASAPLWVAVLEGVRPRGERPTRGMVAGLLIGAVGVVVLVAPELDPAAAGAHPLGISALVFSAFLFAVGTLIVRHKPPSANVTASISWEMLLGGALLLAVGLATGEEGAIHLRDFTAPVLGAFAFLLVVHSLGAFSALNWLLRHFPAPVVTTKFYVSPAIAVTAGWLVMGERVTSGTVASLALILAGVATLLWQGRKAAEEPALLVREADEAEG